MYDFSDAVFAGGDGSENDPYEIENIVQFGHISTFDSNTATVYFKLIEHIDFGDKWAPIPDFYGVLLGNNKIISNLNISVHDDVKYKRPNGLFSRNYGSIKNLTVTGSIFTNRFIQVPVGIVAGENHGTIQNVQATVGINVHWASNVGIIAGENHGTIQNVQASGDISVISADSVGMIAGKNQGMIQNAQASGEIIVNQGEYIGMIAGWNEGNIDTCIVSSNEDYMIDFPNKLFSYIGGITGYNAFSGIIQNCENNGDIYTVANNKGLIAGYNDNGLLTGNGGTGKLYSFGEGGKGTSALPYQISSKQHLEAIPSVDDSGVFFELLNNIDLLGNTWTPLPNFLGIFDGNNNTIYGLYAEQPSGFTGGCGLFEANSGTIKDLHVRGIVVVAQNIRAGMIAGVNFSYGLIQNCTSGYDTGGRNLNSRTGSDARTSVVFAENPNPGGRDIVSPSKHSNSYSGGITGFNFGTVDGCVNNGSIMGMDYTGGVVGYNSYGTVSGSFNTGYISGRLDNVGGLAGYSYQGSVTGSYNTGDIYGSNNTGGVVGYAKSSAISKAYNTGNIEGNNNVGGLAGYAEGAAISKTYNTGNITSYLNINYTGGIVGINIGGSVENSYNTGAVTGNYMTGGVSGYSDNSLLEYCYNTGNIYGTFSTGGIAGSYYILSNDEISNNISLGKQVSSNVYGHRVYGGSFYPYYGNKARNDMIINYGTLDGESVGLGTALSAVYSGWNTGVWSIPGGNLIGNGALPTLNDMPPGPQNPVLVP